MKDIFTRLKLIIILSLCTYPVFAQNNFWKDEQETVLGLKHDPQVSLPKQYRTLGLDTANLIAALKTAPAEFTEAARNNPLILTLPMPGGGFNRFKIVQASMMEPALAAQFPNIKTYGGQGIDDPYATIKIDWTEFGLHAMIFSHIKGAVIIDPYSRESLTTYIAYNKKDVTSSTTFIEDGLGINKEQLSKTLVSGRTTATTCIGGTLRKYRLAVACTAQYASVVSSQPVTTAKTLSAIVTTVNRVNGVYETEVDIRLELVASNDKIIFTSTTTQPFKGNNNAQILIKESQVVIDSLIGSTNYDIGHTFSTGAGGLAAEGVVCDNSFKANGVTGSTRPYGDAYNIDFVAHEMGHQFSGTHTFNAATGNCQAPNGNATTNAEPGSGVTIMGYAGICGSTNNLLPNTLPYFHALSFDQIVNYTNTGFGNTCAVQIATGNKPPVVNAGNDYVIPKSTPFVLTGSASDADGDPLTYSWEQINVGGPFGDWNKPTGDAPIFRSFVPVNTPVRYFPQLTDITNNTTTIGELLPSYARDLQFRLTVRDNRAGGGGVCSDEANVTVDGNAGPFVVTAPNTAVTWTAGSFSTVRWDVARTNLAPVNCTNVNIELSLDGGVTFPVTLLSNTANDGIEEIIVPNNPTTQARVRITAVGNVFFDMSNVNFTINSTTEVGFTFSEPLPVAACNNVAGTVINTNALNKFSTPITLSASGNPAGTTVVFSANPINPGSNDSITLTGTIPKGIYNITITGTAGSVVKSRVIQFTIGTPTKVVVNTLPANNSTGALLQPTFKWNATTDAEYYSLHISTSSTFASTVQSIDSIADSSYTLTTPLAPNTQYYWRVVSQNRCGSGPASAAFLFKTFAIVCGNPAYSTNVPIPIDIHKDTIISTLNIPSGGIINDVDVVGLKGMHTYIGDLIVTLISPANKAVILFSQACGSAQNFNLNFDDEAAHGIICPINDSQTSRPLQPLSAFDNDNSTGTWQLQVTDPVEEDGGSLTNWGLRICTYQQTALPVNWLTFTANKNKNKSVVLQWSTANETNNNYYEIERSADGITFSSIGKIDASTFTGLQQYLYNDLKPLQGDNYYRLKQVDKDGKYTYSKVVRLSFDLSGSGFVVYPNPAVDKSTVRVLNEVKQLTISLRDASGKLVYKRTAGMVKAGETFEIPVKGFGKGVYVLTLTSEKGIFNEKVIIQ